MHQLTRHNTLQHTATHCNTLQHTATHCKTLQHTATHCNTLQHTATHCNTLQHTLTQAVSLHTSFKIFTLLGIFYIHSFKSFLHIFCEVSFAFAFPGLIYIISPQVSFTKSSLGSLFKIEVAAITMLKTCVKEVWGCCN